MGKVLPPTSSRSAAEPDPAQEPPQPQPRGRASFRNNGDSCAAGSRAFRASRRVRGQRRRSEELLSPHPKQLPPEFGTSGTNEASRGQRRAGGRHRSAGKSLPFGVHLQEAALLKHCWNAKHRVQSPRFKHLGYGELRKAPLGPALLLAIPRAAVSLPWGPRCGLPEPLPAGGAR